MNSEKTPNKSHFEKIDFCPSLTNGRKKRVNFHWYLGNLPYLGLIILTIGPKYGKFWYEVDAIPGTSLMIWPAFRDYLWKEITIGNHNMVNSHLNPWLKVPNVARSFLKEGNKWHSQHHYCTPDYLIPLITKPLLSYCSLENTLGLTSKRISLEP